MTLAEVPERIVHSGPFEPSQTSLLFLYSGLTTTKRGNFSISSENTVFARFSEPINDAIADGLEGYGEIDSTYP